MEIRETGASLPRQRTLRTEGSQVAPGAANVEGVALGPDALQTASVEALMQAGLRAAPAGLPPALVGEHLLTMMTEGFQQNPGPQTRAALAAALDRAIAGYRESDPQNPRVQELQASKVWLETIGRLPDAATAAADGEALRNGRSIQQMRDRLAASSEGQARARGGRHLAFEDAMNFAYTAFLASPSDANRQKLLQIMREGVALYGEDQPPSTRLLEYQACEAYMSLLGRMPENEGFGNFVKALEGGADLDAMKREMAASPEARAHRQALSDAAWTILGTGDKRAALEAALRAAQAFREGDPTDAGGQNLNRLATDLASDVDWTPEGRPAAEVEAMRLAAEFTKADPNPNHPDHPARAQAILDKLASAEALAPPPAAPPVLTPPPGLHAAREAFAATPTEENRERFLAEVGPFLDELSANPATRQNQLTLELMLEQAFAGHMGRMPAPGDRAAYMPDLLHGNGIEKVVADIHASVEGQVRDAVRPGPIHPLDRSDQAHQMQAHHERGIAELAGHLGERRGDVRGSLDTLAGEIGQLRRLVQDALEFYRGLDGSNADRGRIKGLEVTKVYLDTLGRMPTEQELARHVGAMVEGGRSLDEIRAEVVGGAEAMEWVRRLASDEQFIHRFAQIAGVLPDAQMLGIMVDMLRALNDGRTAVDDLIRQFEERLAQLALQARASQQAGGAPAPAPDGDQPMADPEYYRQMKERRTIS